MGAICCGREENAEQRLEDLLILGNRSDGLRNEKKFNMLVSQ